MILNDLLNIIESVAPLERQEAWDNSGLQIGERNADIQKVLLTTDVTESVVAEALDQHCQLILSHHPLLFHGLKHLTGATPQERIAETAIRHHLAIYSAHTSMDTYLHGVSGRMAQVLGISNYRILVESGDGYGLGVIGSLPQPLPVAEFLQHVQQAFNAPWIRYTLPADKTTVSTVAMCGGAGAEFLPQAIEQGADAYISADFKYHEMQSVAQQIIVVDMDHWVSEHFTRDIFAELLFSHVTTLISRSDASPIKILNQKSKI